MHRYINQKIGNYENIPNTYVKLMKNMKCTYILYILLFKYLYKIIIELFKFEGKRRKLRLSGVSRDGRDGSRVDSTYRTSYSWCLVDVMH